VAANTSSSRGLFSESVLGIFRIIRGFADLRDLAAETPNKLQPEFESTLRSAGAVLGGGEA
jgi:hypothetical protein